MTQRRQWTSWFKLFGRKRPARRLDDFADYGTAFGLELSLAASQGDTLPATHSAAKASSNEPPRFAATA